MEGLSSHYQELIVLKLKYEHLLEVCRALLKPWPQEPQDSAIEDTELADTKNDSSHDTLVPPGQIRNSPDTLMPPGQIRNSPDTLMPPEVDQLEVLLNKALQIRALKPKKTLNKSATSNSGSEGTCSTSTRSSKSKAASLKHTSRKQSSSPVITPSTTPRTSLPTKLSPLPPIGVSASTSAKSVAQSQGSRPSHSSEQPKRGHDILQKGLQISLPSRYYRLQKTVSRYSEALAENDALITSQVAATHFTKRLLSKKSQGSVSQRIKLQLAVDEITYLKNKLESFTPHDLTVSERNSWEDVLYVKTKLELLADSYRAVCEATMTPPPPPPQTYLPSSAVIKGSIGEGNQTSIYSSLEDWTALQAKELHKSSQQCEMEYLATVLQKTVLPRVSKLMGELRASDDWHSIVRLLQALYLAIGTGDGVSYPVYMDTQCALRK